MNKRFRLEHWIVHLYRIKKRKKTARKILKYFRKWMTAKEHRAREGVVLREWKRKHEKIIATTIIAIVTTPSKTAHHHRKWYVVHPAARHPSKLSFAFRSSADEENSRQEQNRTAHSHEAMEQQLDSIKRASQCTNYSTLFIDFVLDGFVLRRTSNAKHTHKVHRQSGDHYTIIRREARPDRVLLSADKNWRFESGPPKYHYMDMGMGMGLWQPNQLVFVYK